jgi:ABC-type polysaccharide/polyol phosphate export permease
MTSGIAGSAARAGGAAVGIRRYWYPLAALVRRDVKKRYATSVLGLAWTVLQPAILLAIYTVVFGFIFRYGRSAADTPTFVVYLLCGMLPYMSIAEAVHASVGALREDKALLERDTFPAEVVPAARAITASVAEAVGFSLVLLISPFFGIRPTPWLLVLPFLILLRVLLTLGLTWTVSVLAIFVSDFAQVVSLLLTCWLFLTPIFYAPDTVPSVMGRLIMVNPLYAVVQAYRTAIVEGRAPWPGAALAMGWAFLFAAAGLWFFRKTLDRAKDFL